MWSSATYRAELHRAWQRIAGYTDSPDQARVEHGARYLEVIVEEVARAFVDFYRRAAAVGGRLPPAVDSSSLGIEFDREAARAYGFQMTPVPQLRRYDGSFTNW